MTSKEFFIVLGFVLGCNFAIAIQCNFKYVLENDQSLVLESSKSFPNASGKAIQKSGQIFECDDPDGYEVITDSSRVKPMDFDTRFSDDDEYESAANECASHKRTIQPQELNTIYNTLKKIVNNATFIQLIEIDECRPANEPCTNGSEAPIGKKVLCRQKYVKITLKAIQDGDIYDEQFYYPSHCICELVSKRKSST